MLDPNGHGVERQHRAWRILGMLWLGMKCLALFLVVQWLGVAIVCDACAGFLRMS